MEHARATPRRVARAFFDKADLKNQYYSDKSQSPSEPLWKNVWIPNIYNKHNMFETRIITRRTYVTCALRIRAATRASRHACYKESVVVILWVSQYMYRFHTFQESIVFPLGLR